MKLSSSISILFIVSQLLFCICHGQNCSPSTERVKKALLYRNGHVSIGFFHVLLMVVTTCDKQERYHLLELLKEDLSIRINHKDHSYNYCEALQMRADLQHCVRPCSDVYDITNGATMSDINDVIRDYNDDLYIPLAHDCRTFTKAILKRLGKKYSLKCGRNGGHGRASSWRVPGRAPQSCETVGSNKNC